MSVQFDQLSKYLIHEDLNRDSFGTVYRATDTTLDRVVALRILDLLLTRQPGLLARLRDGAARAAGLAHPNIAPIYEAGEAEGRTFVAMAYLPGEPLDQLMATKAPWPLEQALPILTQIAAALDFAHGQGLIHGSLTPSQVLIGHEGHVAVTDFGLPVIDEANSGSLLSSGLLSPAGNLDLALTAAPEVLAGAPAGPEADRYALAALAYRLLAGAWPFTGRTATEVVRARLSRPPADPRTFNAELSEEMSRVLLRGLATRPDQRYGSGAALVAELAAAAAQPWQQIGMQFAPVPAGPFTFGEGNAARITTLPGFSISVYPVTVAQFAAFVAATGYVTQAEREGWGLAFTGARWEQVPGASWRAPGGLGSAISRKEDHPVVQVSCLDAEAFCAWAGLVLPDEMQWEKSARGPVTGSGAGRRYPWGDTWRPELCQHAGSPDRGVAPVSRYEGDASPYGIRGLAGNVWEWTASAYDPAGAYRVLRGGAWPHDGRFLTTTFRYYALPGYRSDALGFRPVLPQKGESDGR